MARFLIAVWPFAGHTFPLVAVAHALRRQGHEVAFYTGAKALPVMAEEGFATFPFRSIDEARVDALMFSQSIYGSRRRPGQLQALLQAWLLGTLPGQVTDLSAILAEWPPDVLVTETSMLGPALILRETTQLPVAVFSTVIACMLPGKESPPFGLGLPAPRTRWTRMLSSAVQRAGNVAGTRFRQAANDLRHDYGLPPLSMTVTEYMGQMALYLVPGVREFDRGRTDLPTSVHYVGPCVWNRSSGEPPDWLAALAGARPVIHITEGTMHTDRPFLLRAAAAGLADLPVDVIMTTGGNRDPEELDLGHCADNTRVVRWVAHADLFPKTDVVVTTGGAGTVMAALLAGTPLVVVPTEWDKAENAQRVAEAGVGIRLPIWRCTPRSLRRAVERILADPSYRANARRLAALLRSHDGPAAAAQLLSGLAVTRQPVAEGVH